MGAGARACHLRGSLHARRWSVSGHGQLVRGRERDRHEQLWLLLRAGRIDQRPALPALRRELATVQERGFALNREGTEARVTAVGRGIAQDGAPVAAISVLAHASPARG